MKVTKPMIIAALVAGNLLAGNMVLRAADTNTPPAGAPPAAPKGPGGPGGPGGGGGIDRLAQQLDLTADQKPKVQAILDESRQKMMALRQDTSLSQDDRTAKRKALRDDLTSQMKGVLTPEQFEKWQKMPPPGRGPRNGPPPGMEKGGVTNAPPPQN
jgi:Spy/CpxP family protein refolding chaperone